jgi:hypothetical protein
VYTICVLGRLTLFLIYFYTYKKKRKKKKLMNEEGMQRKGLRFLSLFLMFEIEFSLFDFKVEEKRKEPICSQFLFFILIINFAFPLC